jgi:hypothetical protein
LNRVQPERPGEFRFVLGFDAVLLVRPIRNAVLQKFVEELFEKKYYGISVLTRIFGGEMDKREIGKRLLDHIDPNRRSFVRQIFGGVALLAPLIAISLMAPEGARAQNPCSVEDTGYAGPALYQVHFKDPSHTTHANGVATFQITGSPLAFPVQTAQAYYSIVLAPPASLVDA